MNKEKQMENAATPRFSRDWGTWAAVTLPAKTPAAWPKTDASRMGIRAARDAQRLPYTATAGRAINT